MSKRMHKRSFSFSPFLLERMWPQHLQAPLFTGFLPCRSFFFDWRQTSYSHTSCNDDSGLCLQERMQKPCQSSPSFLFERLWFGIMQSCCSSCSINTSISTSCSIRTKVCVCQRVQESCQSSSPFLFKGLWLGILQTPCQCIRTQVCMFQRMF